MKDDKVYVDHILLCLDRVAKYTASGHDAYLADTMIQDAVIRNLQTLAESTMRLSDGFKAKCSQIDWKGISSFRNVVVHEYLGLQLNEIWNVVVEDLPALKDCLAKNREKA